MQLPDFVQDLIAKARGQRQRQEVYECVLPYTGRVATMRRLTYLDFMTARQVGHAGFELMLIALTVTVDGEKHEPEWWVDQDLEDMWPLVKEMGKRCKRIFGDA